MFYLNSLSSSDFTCERVSLCFVFVSTSQWVLIVCVWLVLFIFPLSFPYAKVLRPSISLISVRVYRDIKVRLFVFVWVLHDILLLTVLAKLLRQLKHFFLSPLAVLTVKVIGQCLRDWLKEFITSLACCVLINHAHATIHRGSWTVDSQCFATLFNFDVLRNGLLTAGVWACRFILMFLNIRVLLLGDRKTHDGT